MFTIIVFECILSIQITVGSPAGLLHYTLYRIDGITFALCMSTIVHSNCSIQYTTDPNYSDLSSPVVGPINIPFVIPNMETSIAAVYHQATVLAVVLLNFEIVVKSSGVYAIDNDENINNSTMRPVLPTGVSGHGAALNVEVYQLGIVVIAFVVLILVLIVSIIFVILQTLKGIL